MDVKLVGLSLLHTVLNVGGVALLRIALRDVALDGPAAFAAALLHGKTMVGVVLVGLGFLVVLKMLSLAELVRTVPLVAATDFVVTALVGVFLLREQFTFRLAGGMALILVGIGLLSRR